MKKNKLKQKILPIFYDNKIVNWEIILNSLVFWFILIVRIIILFKFIGFNYLWTTKIVLYSSIAIILLLSIIWIYLIAKNKYKYDFLQLHDEYFKEPFLISFIYWLFWYYLVFVKWYFFPESITELTYFLVFYTFLTLFLSFIINKSLKFIYSVLLFNNSKYLYIFSFILNMIIISMFMFSFNWVLDNDTNLNVYNTELLLYLAFFFLLFFNLYILIPKSNIFKGVILSFLSFFVVIKIFSLIPNTILFWLKDISWALIIKQSDLSDFYNDIKYNQDFLTKNFLTKNKDEVWKYDDENNKNYDLLNINFDNICYSKSENLYFYNTKQVFNDWKYTYIKVWNSIKYIDKSKYRFLNANFSCGDKTSTWVLFNIKWATLNKLDSNILNSKIYLNFLKIKVNIINKYSSWYILSDNWIIDYKKATNELMVLVNFSNFYYNINYLNLFKYIYEWINWNIHINEINNLINDNKNIITDDYFIFDKNILKTWVDKNYWLFLEYIFLISNKLNNKKFINNIESLDIDVWWLTFDLNNCLNNNDKDSCKIFNFNNYKKEYIKSKYWFILDNRSLDWEQFNKKLLEYISWKSEVIKY